LLSSQKYISDDLFRVAPYRIMLVIHNDSLYH
jgi:hypothetical protein